MFLRREIREPLADAAVDLGVDDGFEIGAGDAIAEDQPAEGRTIERAIGAQVGGTEAIDDARQSSRAGGDGVAGELVGIDDRGTEGSKPGEAIRLPRRDAAGQGCPPHGHMAARRAAAALTVLRSRTAIVSGPTPPGTGVSAPATSATRRVHVADDHGPAAFEVGQARRVRERTGHAPAPGR